ncbi:hypothetical protein FFF34_012000 [Inquilinus sp. KBS0705]|nr:hypothetical protein FFF34_012000 [Inquilinus sp. KBS0705]
MRSKLLCLFLLLISMAAKAAPGELKVSLDFESAQVITWLLSGKTVTDAQINQAAAVYGNQQLIKKVKGYSGFGEDVFKSTLKEIIETGTIKGNDPYNWKMVKANLPAIQNLLGKLAQNQQAFLNDVTAIIQAYTPAEVSAEVRACFLVGGGSLGFVIGDEKTFNVALQKIGDDYEGLKYLVAHELYHSMQGAGQAMRKKNKEKNAPYYVQASYALAYNVWCEGTANLVGDFAQVKNPAPFSKVQADEWQKNADRKGENFYLFESLLYKSHNDTASRGYETFYNIAFTTAYDETSYFTGYEMAKKIEKYSGKKVIANILVQDPLVFFEEYIKLYKAHPEDTSFIRFDASTELIISRLAVWKDRL